MPASKQLATEVLIGLHEKLTGMTPRAPSRRDLITETAGAYGISVSTLYRQLKLLYKPKSLRRKDHGRPRSISPNDLMRYCEIIAALKIRTLNRNGRHISTVGAINLLETEGIHSDYGFVRPEAGTLKKSTVNRYLRLWGLDFGSVLRDTPAVRFQASHSNQCWQFDLSPSDLKHVSEPLWYDKEKGRPILMLFSVVDDRSGVCYQEYRNVYGEDAASALRFLFNAMSKKTDPDFPFQGIPECIYTDNGPIARSRVFRNVMAYLGVTVRTHMPDSRDPHRKTARSKGKVERAFRTVKECHEVLYHLREPRNELEANQRLLDYLKTYNDHPHRSGHCSRMEDWQSNLDDAGARAMCNWERYCVFAREPEKKKAGIDARISVDGTTYELSPELAGEQVTLWWGLFDDELYAECSGNRFGPYLPVSGPTPLYRYRKFAKTGLQKKREKLEALAATLTLDEPDKGDFPLLPGTSDDVPLTPFEDPDPFNEFAYENTMKARLAISDYLGHPLALLPQADRDVIEDIVNETLDKKEVISRVREHFATNEDKTCRSK